MLGVIGIHMWDCLRRELQNKKSEENLDWNPGKFQAVETEARETSVLWTQRKKAWVNSGQGGWDHRGSTGFCQLEANFYYHQYLF